MKRVFIFVILTVSVSLAGCNRHFLGPDRYRPHYDDHRIYRHEPNRRDMRRPDRTWQERRNVPMERRDRPSPFRPH